MKKLFSSYFGGTSNNKTESSKNLDPVASLAESVNQLKRTVESSKIFMRAIIEKIRYQGKIKIVNKLNGNPKHPAFESSFPDLHKPIPKRNHKYGFYGLERFHEHFDLPKIKNISSISNNSIKKTYKNTQQSYSDDVVNHNPWHVSDRLNSYENIIFTIKSFDAIYERLKLSDSLNEKFMTDVNPSLFIINDHIMSLKNKSEMIKDFKEMIPNIAFQKLLSIYANQEFLYQSYLQFGSEHQDMSKYRIKHSQNIYKINTLDDGSIKLVATNLSDLDIKNENDIQKYKSFGIRATVIFPRNDVPLIKYSHFLK